MHMSETVMGVPENPMRLRMEEAAQMAGLEYIVNVVYRHRPSEIVGCFTRRLRSMPIAKAANALAKFMPLTCRRAPTSC